MNPRLKFGPKTPLGWSAGLAGLVLLSISSCVGPRPALDEVLAETASTESGSFPAAADFDTRAREARQQVIRKPGQAEPLLQASRALFLSADVRLEYATLALLESTESPKLNDLLRAYDRVNDDLRAEVETLSREGLGLAEHALKIAPDDPGALLQRAIHSTLLAWAVGPARAVLSGLAGKSDRSTAACLKASDSLEGAAPLRVRGRFLSEAPWPLGDNKRAIELLRRAVEIAPVTLNWLFLGDALYAKGDKQGAREAWQRAAAAESDPDSAVMGAFHREFARQRVALQPE